MPITQLHPTPIYRGITRKNIATQPQWEKIPEDIRHGIMVASTVLPFKTNEYVLNEMVDWDRAPNDPMFQLGFVQREMLQADDFATMESLLAREASPAELKAAANEIRLRMNPHPAGQLSHNVPSLEGRPVPGIQHKYRETVLFFPAQGQTCHAYCTFCFRWAQFVGIGDLKFSTGTADNLVAYLKANPSVTDVLITGGDPLVMGSKVLRRYLEPLLSADLPQIRNIRIGTKSVAWWPHRFVSDADADDTLRLFEEIVASGKHLAIMGHYNHPTELRSPVAKAAVRRIRSTGAVVRMQSPLLRHVNADANSWAELWRQGVQLGAVPYYMFVERDTGPRGYFEVPLAEASSIFREAYQQVSGLARTVRGPSMSSHPGKIAVVGTAEIRGERVFVLEFLQARKPEWVGRPFFAEFDEKVCWLSGLKPAFGESKFFFEREEPPALARDALRLPLLG